MVEYIVRDDVTPVQFRVAPSNKQVTVAQWSEQWIADPTVDGSTPSGDFKTKGAIV